jgi:hypothetical protein
MGRCSAQGGDAGINVRRYVRLGSKADLTTPKSDFRYTPESGLKTDIAPCPKSADTVAEVVLHKWSKIPRAAGAVFV